MKAVLIAVAIALAATARAQPEKASELGGAGRQAVEDQSGQLKTTPWGNTGGDAASARDNQSPQQRREIQAAGVLGLTIIGLGMFALGERRHLRRFDNPGGHQPFGPKS